LIDGLLLVEGGYILMKYCVTINNKRYEVEVEKGSAAIVSTKEIAVGVEEKSNPVDTQVENNNTVNTQPSSEIIAPKVIESSERTDEVSPAAAKEVVKAPMAGGIIAVKVTVGSAVKKGDILLLLEAMKMENEITAHVDGIVADIKVAKGANVSSDEVLMVIK
jgi:glutaconyl-CoA/methylmalonyl-CoA decarboxylase subunit gamma